MNLAVVSSEDVFVFREPSRPSWRSGPLEKRLLRSSTALSAQHYVPKLLRKAAKSNRLTMSLPSLS